MMCRIESWHWTISTGRHFQNGHHKAILKIATSRNCSMSGINSGHHYLPTYQIVMISDNVDFLRSRQWQISTGRHFQNGRHNTTQIQHCPIWTPFHMWVYYDVSNWFMTLNNFSGINSGHHNLPTYEMALKSDNVDLVWHCGGHFENGDQ
jgi:hypothetical protein